MFRPSCSELVGLDDNVSIFRAWQEVERLTIEVHRQVDERRVSSEDEEKFDQAPLGRPQEIYLVL